ncbi:MAG: hypothetical protein R2703_02190 [Micropruina glycogenica]
MLAQHAGRVVAVQQGSIIGLAFHPELTGELLFHQHLLGLVRLVAPNPVMPADAGISA